MPVDKSKLVTKSSSANNLSTFLFEPNELVDYEKALRWQQNWQKRLIFGPETAQAVWLLEHPICYTMGKGASQKNLLFDPNTSPWPLYRINRGGEATCHLPGQLVAYPILDLRRYTTDLHWYLRKLEDVLIDVLANLELHGERVKGLTGLWINGQKVAAIGVGCRRWITQHGFSLNINCEMESFKKVVPCGLINHPVGKLNDWIPGLTIKEVKPLLTRSLEKQFSLKWQQIGPMERTEDFATPIQMIHKKNFKDENH